MISGGAHLEYPIELQSGKEMEMEQAFDEAMWEWVLEQGPPQDDDIVWLKKTVMEAMRAAPPILTPQTYGTFMARLEVL